MRGDEGRKKRLGGKPSYIDLVPSYFGTRLRAATSSFGGEPELHILQSMDHYNYIITATLEDTKKKTPKKTPKFPKFQGCCKRSVRAKE